MVWGVSRHQCALTVPLNVSNFHPGVETSELDVIPLPANASLQIISFSGVYKLRKSIN